MFLKENSLPSCFNLARSQKLPFLLTRARTPNRMELNKRQHVILATPSSIRTERKFGVLTFSAAVIAGRCRCRRSGRGGPSPPAVWEKLRTFLSHTFVPSTPGLPPAAAGCLRLRAPRLQAQVVQGDP